MSAMEIFSKNVKLQLEVSEWTRQDLAEQLGVTPSAVSHLLNGSETNITLNRAQAIAEVFEISLVEILSESFEPLLAVAS